MDIIGPVGILVSILLAVEFGVRVYQRLTQGSPPLLAAYRAPRAKVLAYESHPYALYVKRPGVAGLYPSNNLGYGGTRAVVRQKAPGVVRIYCAGGSTTEQHDPARGPNSSWPGQLQDILAKGLPGATIEGINAGMSGYTSAESLAEFVFRGVDLQPDVLLIYHNVNDAWTCQMVDGFRSDYTHVRRHKPWSVGWVNRLPQMPYVRFWELLRGRVIERLGRAQSLLYWISDPPWDTASVASAEAVRVFRRNVTNLVASATQWGCVPVLIKWECDWAEVQLPPFLERTEDTARTFCEYLRRNNSVLEEVAAASDRCHHLDVGPFETKHFGPDGMHFSGEGLAEMARRVARGVEPIVTRIVERRPASIASPGITRS
jgi:lysophospholipase L1-like esterase